MAARNKQKPVAQIGSLSSGTMRSEDLIPCFLDELLRLDPENKEAKELEATIEDHDGIDAYCENHDDTCETVDWLFDELNNFAPSYCYFGANEGDGSDYGFWLSHDSIEDAIHDGVLIEIDAGDDRPKDALEVLEVTDHGNMSLYARNTVRSKWREVWAIV